MTVVFRCLLVGVGSAFPQNPLLGLFPGLQQFWLALEVWAAKAEDIAQRARKKSEQRFQVPL